MRRTRSERVSRMQSTDGARLRPVVYRASEGDAPKILVQVCTERGWIPYDEHTHGRNQWNLWWRTTRWPTNFGVQLQPGQFVNHVPQGGRITRKDHLARHLRCMFRIYGNVYNFSPPAFILPNEFLKFVTEYNKPKDRKDNFWICKPTDQSRGQGILIFNNINDLVYNCSVVVQKYISNPFLVSGYKFDLRLYVCVPSFHPLTVYVHRAGLVRFGTEKYSLSVLQNVFSHLTNTSINKFSPSFDDGKGRIGPGCKWRLSQLRQFFHQLKINDWFLWQRISCIITLTLLCQVPETPRTCNGFELYGFDILIDANLRPWLLEVNRNPSMNQDTDVDVDVKKNMLHDLLDLLGLDHWDDESSSGHHHHHMTDRLPLMARHVTSCLTTMPIVLRKKNRERSKRSGSEASKGQNVRLCQRRNAAAAERTASLRKIKGRRGLGSRSFSISDDDDDDEEEEDEDEDDDDESESSVKSSTSLSGDDVKGRPKAAGSASCFSRESVGGRTTSDPRNSKGSARRLHYSANHPNFRWNNPPVRVGDFVRIFPLGGRQQPPATTGTARSNDPLNLRSVVLEIQTLLRLSENVIKTSQRRGEFFSDEECIQTLRDLAGEPLEVWLPPKW